ncbi:hypothetical protein HD806DRAFT_519666 [Xylariaceae sp. AK1471]|nr:hypothetical protein HD806DRAFT_519666 [Xylariaceae sp. AK1471]
MPGLTTDSHVEPRVPRQLPGPACEECRRKRVRCDRRFPQCELCANSGIPCIVRSSPPPRGPKKGYIRTLQRQVEDLQARLNDQAGPEEGTGHHTGQPSHMAQLPNPTHGTGGDRNESHSHPPCTLTEVVENVDGLQSWSPRMVELVALLQPAGPEPGGIIPRPALTLPVPDLLNQVPSHVSTTMDMNLTPMICTDLDQLFFDRVYPFAPIVHKFRYLSWSQQTDKSKQKLCLQHAMRTLAASFSSQFQLLRNDLYKQARELLHALETNDQESSACAYTFSIEHIQAWILLAMYEWMSNAGNYHCGMVSAGRGFRLIQLMRLYDLDKDQSTGAGNNCNNEIPRDWVDTESMRRTFWLAFTIDRFTSAIDDLPLNFDERQIRTRLPAPEASFTNAEATTTLFLSETINAIENERQVDSISPFTQSIIAATVCGRVLEHRHRSPGPVVHQPPHMMNARHPEHIRDAMYKFCNRHRSINSLLSQHQKLLVVGNVPDRPDPLLIFVVLTEYMAVFMLYETMESKLFGSDIHAKQVADALTAEQRQQLVDAVDDLSALTATLRQLNYFQTHPLLPIPLFSIAKFCLAHNRLHENSYSSLIPHVSSALQGLVGINALAQIAIQLLRSYD